MMAMRVLRRLALAIGLCGGAWACGSDGSSGTAAADTAAADTVAGDTAAEDTATAGDTSAADSSAADTAVADTSAADADAADTNPANCPANDEGLCCCAGDVAAELTCVDGAWTCPSGFGTFKGDQCNGSVCGGPCSLPCPSPAVLCNNTGGKAVTSLCCTSTQDFPNTCAIGACGCAPASSHEVQTCECPSGQCFLPSSGCTTL